MAIALKFNTGATVTLRETLGKKGNTFLAVRPASETMVSRFGFNVKSSLIGDKLPTSAQVLKDGQPIGTIALVEGLTAPNPKDPRSTGNPKVSGTSTVAIDVDGEVQNLKIERISQPRLGTFNVLIRSSRPTAGAVHDEL